MTPPPPPPPTPPPPLPLPPGGRGRVGGERIKVRGPSQSEGVCLLQQARFPVVLLRSRMVRHPETLGHLLGRDSLHRGRHVTEGIPPLDDRLGHLVDRLHGRLRRRDEDCRGLDRHYFLVDAVGRVGPLG